MLGSNTGDRQKYLKGAVDRLGELEGMEIIAISSVYLTRPQEMEGENPDFLNQAVKADYQFTPHELIRALEKIEEDLGRTDKGQNKPRTIDLDILLFGDLNVKSDKLEIPHPRLLDRPLRDGPPAGHRPGVGAPGHRQTDWHLREQEGSSRRSAV